MSDKKRRLLKTAITVLVMLVLSCLPALASFSATINADNVYFYKKSSTSSASIALTKNQKVTVTEAGSTWSRVKYSGVTGYVLTKYLDRVEPVTAYTTRACKAYTSTGSGASVNVSKGTKVSVVGLNGNYARVKKNGVSAYIYKGYLSSSKPTTASSKLTKLMLVAKAQLGKPYKTGCNPPSSFDCSGFTRYCYSQIGYNIGDNAYSQASNNSLKMVKKLADVQAGDLLFFDTANDGNPCDHVGLYIGSGKMVHASRNAGKVLVSSIRTNYWETHFKGARRVL